MKMSRAITKVSFVISLLFLTLVDTISATDGGYEKPETKNENLLSTLIGIQGHVYCKLPSKHVPLEGAVTRITCLRDDEYEYETAALSFLSEATDAGGYFLATLSPYEVEESWRIKGCKAFLELSSSDSCKVATDVNKGIGGALLGSNRKKPKRRSLYLLGSEQKQTNLSFLGETQTKRNRVILVNRWRSSTEAYTHRDRAQIRIDGGGNFGGLVVLGGALAVAGVIAVSAIIGRRGDDAAKEKHRSTKFKEDASIGDLQATPPQSAAAASQQNQCCTGTSGLAEICETKMVDSCVVSSRSLMMMVKEVSTPVIIEGDAEYSPGTDLKTLPYDQVENIIEEETKELADKMNSEDVSVLEKEPEEEKEEQRQEDEDDEEETTVDDQKTAEDVSSVLSIQEKEKQTDEDQDLGAEEDVNSGGTGSTSTEAISPAESIDALSLETKKGGVVMEVGANGGKEYDQESSRTDDHGTTTENPVSQTLKPIVDSYETTHSSSMSRLLMRRSWSVLVLLAMVLLLFTHLSSSVRHLLHLDSSLVP